MAEDGEYRVKGSSLTTKLAFVRERAGAEVEQNLRQELRSEGLFLILESDWYPYRLFDRLNVLVAEACFGGDLRRLTEVGRHSAHKVLGSTYGVYSGGASFESFLSKVAGLHDRFYSHGEMRHRLGADGRSCTIFLDGAPDYSDSDLYVACGFYAGAAERFGLEGVEHRFERRDGGARLLLSWSGEGAGTGGGA
ncbi:MAG: hypothetical protein SX243_08885 [Acidobacteriota bacterium]|nr:hypothetical protein [Acidobacteriota bacterium]